MIASPNPTTTMKSEEVEATVVDSHFEQRNQDAILLEFHNIYRKEGPNIWELKQQRLRGEQVNDWHKWKAPTEEGTKAKLRLLAMHWKPSKRMADTLIPFTESVFTSMIRGRSQYLPLWHNNGGGSTCITKPARAMLQTPNDGGPFLSFSQNVGDDGFQAIYISSDPSIALFEDMIAQYNRADEWCDGVPFLDLPTKVLEHLAAQSARSMDPLVQAVTETERYVASGGSYLSNSDCDEVIRKLNFYNSELLKLRSRWHVEKTFGEQMMAYLATLDQECENHRFRFMNPPHMYHDISRGRVQSAIALSNSKTYDIEDLPMRIRNLSTAVFNLTVQRDSRMNIELTKLSVQIADDSRTIAAAALRDSSSIMTITILAVVFLPISTMASFFSMTMFNWSAGPDQAIVSSYLWVYFVVTVPVAGLILAAWWYGTRRRRKAAEKRRLVATENLKVKSF